MFNYILVLFLLITSSISKIDLPNHSIYYSQSGIIYCNNVEPYKGCRHEIGHKMDWDLGNPSQTIDFAIAIEVQKQTMWKTLNLDGLAVFISVYPVQTPVELYAAIYTYTNGDISKLPESLQKFYTDDPSYLDLYDCLDNPGFNICDGKSISLLVKG